jgi:dihydrofolate synthase/folylpolyglutamate synthase
MDQNVYQRLENLQKTGIKLGLRNIQQLLEKLDHPEKSWRGILIAGTNGKGSVGAMLDSMLRHHGLSTGQYTSPHLVDLRERIRVNGNMIDESQMASALQAVFAATDACQSEGKLETPPTFFETLTAAAFLHFRAAGVQWGVIEVGLGGRFDATNALQQSLSIITNVDRNTWATVWLRLRARKQGS